MIKRFSWQKAQSKNLRLKHLRNRIEIVRKPWSSLISTIALKVLTLQAL